MARNDTIAAIATPAGRGAIGVVRISGERLTPFLDALIGKPAMPRRATRATFRDCDGQIIDEGLTLFFPAPNSYTGEDVIELQGHGGLAVLRLLLARCLELGARVAEPGEFTRRAFLNDKMDLAQAESVADLIDAATEEAARCALRSLQGEFSGRIDKMVQGLIDLRMLVEATLDFPEEDEQFLQEAGAHAKLTQLSAELAQILAASRRGSLLREGLQVVLAGAPNVGKSSLLNRLAGNERAIVTDLPGTTRDALREPVSLQGVPIHIIDTAGLRHSEDLVEKIGISKTWDAIRGADLVVWVADVTRPETHRIEADIVAGIKAQVVVAMNKIDLPGESPRREIRGEMTRIWMSAKTGGGVELLQQTILEHAGWTTSGEGLYMARARHLHALESARAHLEGASRNPGQLELFAEELRLAQEALITITGKFTADDLLGEIFSRFCIGK